MISAKDRAAFQDIASERVTVVPRKPWAVFCAIFKAQIVIQGGGTIFHDSYSEKAKLLRYWVNLTLWVGVFLWSRLCGRRTLMLGVGLVPQQYWPTRILTGIALRLMHGVMVRDDASLEVAKEYCPVDQVALGRDLSFFAPITRVGMNHQSEKDVDGVDLAISLCDLGQFYGGPYHDQNYWQSLAGAINALAAENDNMYKVSLLNLFTGSGRHDGIAGRDFAEMLDSDQVEIEILDYESDPHPILATIKRCKLLIATRFHAAVTGFILNRPLLLVSYNRKLSDFGIIIGLPDQLILPIDRILSKEEWTEAIQNASGLDSAMLASKVDLFSRNDQNLKEMLFGK